MIDEKSTERYTNTSRADHDLVTKSFLKKFADKSKDIFRAEQIDCNGYRYLTIVTDVPVQKEGFAPQKFIIDIKDSNSYDTIITWDIDKDNETGEQKSSVHVLCKGDPFPVYFCKYLENAVNTAYYTFIIELTTSSFATVDVTELNVKKNSLKDWHIYPSNNIDFETKENVVYLKTLVKDSIYLLKGDGTEDNPYEEDLKYLDFEEALLDEYKLLGSAVYDEKLYVKGDIPSLIYFKSNDNTSPVESAKGILVTGMEFILVNYIYYKEDSDNEILSELFDNASFTGHLKLAEACVKYNEFRNIDEIETKSYDDLEETLETSFTSCLISENSNNGNGNIQGVFDATRALLAKEADHAKETNHSKETDKFSEDKTISFPESSDFIKYGEPTTSNFENEIELPKVIFDGITPKKTSDTSTLRPTNIDEGGEWFNRIFIKPEHNGLVYRVTNVEESGNTSALPYEKDSDDLYFRIDPDKSIDDNKTLQASFYDIISKLSITGVSNQPLGEATGLQQIATITSPSAQKFKILAIDSYSSNIITTDNGALDSVKLMSNSSSQNLALYMGSTCTDSIKIGIWHVENTLNGMHNDYDHTNSYITFYNQGEDYKTYEDNGTTIRYQWREINIPEGDTYIYIDVNTSVHSFNGSRILLHTTPSEEYLRLFNAIQGETPYVEIPYLGNLIILGKDGLLIGKGSNIYKIQITADGTITAGQVTE